MISSFIVFVWLKFKTKNVKQTDKCFSVLHLILKKDYAYLSWVDFIWW